MALLRFRSTKAGDPYPVHIRGSRYGRIDGPTFSLALSQLRPTQPDSKLHRPTVEYYKDQFRRGRKVQPIIVEDAGDHWGVLNGHHRFKAARELGLNGVVVVDTRNVVEEP